MPDDAITFPLVFANRIRIRNFFMTCPMTPIYGYIWNKCIDHGNKGEDTGKEEVDDAGYDSEPGSNEGS